jgi:hypothetical protein
MARMYPTRSRGLGAAARALAITAAIASPGCGGGGTGTADAGDGTGDGGADPDGGGGPDPSDALFDPGVVPTFEIELDAAAIEALESDPGTYARGTLRYGDLTLTDVGVRLKGEYTFRPLGQKASFKLKLDEFVDGQELFGLTKLTLNNELEDPSFVAERLTYAVFRAAGRPAPRANSAWVTVNGEDYGLYANIETEDKRWLARWFADNDGNLYEEQAADFYPGNEQQFELETNEAADDRSDLTALFAAIEDADDATLLADLAGVLDGPAFLRFCALEAAVWQWDGYCYTRFGPNNFRLYHEPTAGLFYLLPWGMDMSWKPYEGSLDVLDARGMLLQRCVDAEACRADYLAEVAAIADVLDAMDPAALVDAWGAQLAPLVAADPKKEISTEDFEATLAEVRDQAAARAADLRDQAE